jgi:hypothetical protein
MDAFYIVAAILCAWATLRVIGSERERRIRDLPNVLAATRAAAIAAEAANAPQVGGPAAAHNSPVRSKAAR